MVLCQDKRKSLILCSWLIARPYNSRGSLSTQMLFPSITMAMPAYHLHWLFLGAIDMAKCMHGGSSEGNLVTGHFYNFQLVLGRPHEWVTIIFSSYINVSLSASLTSKAMAVIVLKHRASTLGQLGPTFCFVFLREISCWPLHSPSKYY